MKQYAFAKENIFLHRQNQDFLVTIDNYTLSENTNEGLFVNLDKFVAVGGHGGFRPRQSYSTSNCYVASAEFRKLLGDSAWPNKGREPIGERLLPELIGFKRHSSEDPETHGLLEENMLIPMPWIVSSAFPLLTAARANIQCEFDRTYRTLLNSHVYEGKRLLFISGLNVDISPQPDQVFPSTTFVPWAAYIHDPKGKSSVLEQQDLLGRLLEQREDNPDEVDLEVAIQHMKDVEEIKIKIV